jgi:hypothetical protein
MINQDICNFYNALTVYAEYGGVVFAAQEGKNIAKAIGENSKVCQSLAVLFLRQNTHAVKD